MPDEDEARNISIRLPPETYRALMKHQKTLEKKVGVDLAISAIVRSIVEEKLGVKST